MAHARTGVVQRRVILDALSTDCFGPDAPGDEGEALWRAHQFVPSVAAGILRSHALQGRCGSGLAGGDRSFVPDAAPCRHRRRGSRRRTLISA